MEPPESNELKPNALVWVWIVRFGKGRWWPGLVVRVESHDGTPLIMVRYQSFSRSRNRIDPPITLGWITAPMRRLERRDSSAKGSDRPRFVPTSRLRKPESPILPTSPLASESPAQASAKSIGANGSLDAEASLRHGKRPPLLRNATFASHLREDQRRTGLTAPQLESADGEDSGRNPESKKRGICVPIGPAKRI